MTLEDVGKPRIERITRMKRLVTRLVAIPLDFCQDTTDNNIITPVPPLPLVGEVHLGQVFLCPDGNLSRRGGHSE